jgi:hypothetical protein
LREKRRLRFFENSALRKIFGTKIDEVTGEWIKLHNEEVSDLYCSPNIVRVIKCGKILDCLQTGQLLKKDCCME